MKKYKNIDKEFNPAVNHPSYIIRRRLLQNIDRISHLVKGRVMDLGCGSKPYRSLFTCDEYIGVDFENPGHPHINEDIDVYYDGKHLPFDDGSFDVVFCSEVFEHVFNLEELLDEINRVLRKGGLLIFTCPFAFPEHEQPNDFARYTSFAIAELMRRSDFSIQQFVKSGNSVETIGQLNVTYAHLHIVARFKHIPVIRQAMRVLVYTSLNCYTLLKSYLLPSANDLYLNNIVVASKN